MTPSDKTNLFLEYIRTSYERTSEEEQNTGVTKWAVMAAIAYLFWQSVPLLAKLQSDPQSWSQLWLLSAHLSVIVFVIHFVYQGLGIGNSASPYDRRQEVGENSVQLPLIIIQIFVSFGPCIAFSWVAWNDFIGLSDLHYRYLNLITWIFSFLSAPIFIISVYQHNYIKNNGFLPPISFTKKSGASFKFVLLGFALFFLIASSYYAVIAAKFVSKESFESVLLLGGSIAILGPCISVLLAAIPRRGRLQILAKLERDIVIHQLSPEEIKTRLEEDLIGLEIGDWAKTRIDGVRALQIALLAYCNEADEAIGKIVELDISLKFERDGRARECLNRLTNDFGKLEKEWDPLYSWMTSYLSQPSTDSYIAQVVKAAREDLSALMKQSTQRVRNTITSLEQQLKRI